jgi:hypothetical protein
MSKSGKIYGKHSAKVTKQGGANESEVVDAFKQNLEDEKKEQAEAKAKYKTSGPDGFTKLLMDVFELECEPAFKRDFTDPRWPRNEVGENIKVDRVYFLALRGPREAKLGFRSLGQDEINGDAKIIIDRIGKDVKEEIVLAKKWTAEQSFYRYFWIRENEKFEDSEVGKVFLARFSPLTKKPDFAYKPIGSHMSLVMNNPNGEWIR